MNKTPDFEKPGYWQAARIEDQQQAQRLATLCGTVTAEQALQVMQAYFATEYNPPEPTLSEDGESLYVLDQYSQGYAVNKDLSFYPVGG